MYVKQSEASTAGTVVTAERWNELWTLLIAQGDNNTEYLDLLAAYLFDDGAEIETLEAAITAIELSIANHLADVANPHSVTKTQVGLGNVDNTSDKDKPISTLQAVSIATKVGNTGNETIAGIKTFSSSPIVPTPITSMQASTKKYVDEVARAFVLGEGLGDMRTHIYDPT